MKAEMVAAAITLTGMAAWGWIAAKRAHMMECQIKQNLDLLRYSEEQLRRIDTAATMMGLALNGRRGATSRHLHVVS